MGQIFRKGLSDNFEMKIFLGEGGNEDGGINEITKGEGGNTNWS